MIVQTYHVNSVLPIQCLQLIVSNDRVIIWIGVIEARCECDKGFI